MIMSIKRSLWVILLLCNAKHGLSLHFVDVGIVLDVESSIGRSINRSITMAISDFYARNDGYRTRIVLHTRDTKGDPSRTISNVLDLVNRVKVKAIIGPETYIGSNLLASITHEAKVPVFSFAGKSKVNESPYLFQIKEDEISMAKSVAALVESYKWRDVIYVYEDTDDGSETLQNLYESFQDQSIRIVYKSAIFALASNDQVVIELHKLMKIRTSVIIVNVSPLLASRLFVNAKMLGMMSDEYAWILMSKTIEIMHSTEYKVFQSLQGALGVRSYMPTSSRLHNFKEKWLHHFLMREVPMIAIWAYDTFWVLAESIERVGVHAKNGPMLLTEVLKTRINGVSGRFRLSERRLAFKRYEIINMVDHGGKRVGYWTSSKGIRRAHLPLNGAYLHSSTNGIKDVVWPGGSTTTPKGWILRTSLGKTLRIGIVIDVPFKYFVDANYDAEKNVITSATGFSVAVFNTCMYALGYQYKVHYDFIPVNYDKYDNLIQKVYDKEIDGLLGDTTILANRSEYVDFTTTYTDVGIGTLTRIKENDSSIFLKPLDVGLWIAFIVCGILTVFTAWAIEAMGGQGPERSPSQGFWSIFWVFFLALFFALGDKLSKFLSKVVMFVWLILVLVLITSYQATLTSLLTVKQFELASKGGVVGFHGDSFFGGVTINNVKLIDNLQKPYYSYEDYADALSKGGKHGGADAIVDEVPYIKMFLGRHSKDYSMVLSQSITSGFGFVFAKNSPLVKDMSREIARIREDGTLRDLEKKWFEKEFPLLSEDSATVMPKTLNLDNFWDLFVIIVSSLGLALIASAFYEFFATRVLRPISAFIAGH
uniref:glutamate receptor 1.2-like n=1 Tax=Erigeron canadensis TaxID=72917 RepID=UPI001CB94EE1|nr:glutamate receptor 1.2-like [Erigeron canadensis]